MAIRREAHACVRRQGYRSGAGNGRRAVLVRGQCPIDDQGTDGILPKPKAVSLPGKARLPPESFVGARAIQCVVDLSAFQSKAARQRFMRAFLEAVAETNRQPLHLVLDEADLWSPQRPMPDQMMLQGLVGEIVRRGRVRGFIPWLLTQRPAVLDKDVLSQADVLVAMKLTSSQDRAAIGAWIEGQADKAQEKRVIADLPRLKQGEGYVWAPGHGVLERIAFPAIATFDSSRTPRRGDRSATPTLAVVDAVAELSAALAALRATSTKVAGKYTPLATATSDAIAAARDEGYRAGLAQGQRLADELRERWTKAEALLLAAIEAGRGVGAPVPAPPRVVVPPPRPIAVFPADGKLELHPAARAILAVLAARPGKPLTWRQVATLAGLAPRGGHWESGRRQLRDMALVTEAAAGVTLTHAGSARAGTAPGSAPSAAGLLDLWCSKLPAAAPQMLRELAASPAMSWADLAAKLGKAPRGGHWETGRRALRDNQLVVEQNGLVDVVPELRVAGA